MKKMKDEEKNDLINIYMVMNKYGNAFNSLFNNVALSKHTSPLERVKFNFVY